MPVITNNAHSNNVIPYSIKWEEVVGETSYEVERQVEGDLKRKYRSTEENIFEV